ncbi:hypothetical protein GK047_02435 [Paenibacillus sp. SYP-B3998]|uniref:BRCT domain-containing protein n=1 Tax=Paenibacillus sp. SYP-B3998 TaxID=2678564 RepID=A0A6G3ZRN8_9BACL|nr:hypothetical protein [Paenibacillus sp. SYP-B3998]NEW04876.1 hypothetical protein [Paenibacillus sp. SYP-B3998]
MLPIYGKIAMLLMFLIIIPGAGVAIYFGSVKKNESKMVASIVMTIVPCIPLAIMLITAANQKSGNEIETQIKSLGGTLVSVQKVKSNETPFIPVPKTFGEHYKIQYKLSGQIRVAWFRSEKALIQSPEPVFEEKWILQ